MMGLFKKKLSDEELIKKNIEAQQAEIEEKDAANQKKEDDMGDSKVGIEITKIKAQLEGLNEQRKASSERFSRISEEIGEVRGMVMDTNKSVGNIEASATKAIDLVESVKPDQLMLEVRKQDMKIESLKASIESNESLMKDMMKEVKEMRKKMDFYKGVEQVAKLNDEIKKELIDMKKLEGEIERHSNKVETIFVDVSKKYTEFDNYGDTAKDLQRNFEKLQGDVDKLRVKAEDKASKKEMLNLITKFNDFEKHTTNIINLLDDRSKSIDEESKTNFEALKSEILAKINNATKKIGKKVESLNTEYEGSEKEEIDVKKLKESIPVVEKSSKIKVLLGKIKGIFNKSKTSKSESLNEEKNQNEEESKKEVDVEQENKEQDQNEKPETEIETESKEEKEKNNSDEEENQDQEKEKSIEENQESTEAKEQEYMNQNLEQSSEDEKKTQNDGQEASEQNVNQKESIEENQDQEKEEGKENQEQSSEAQDSKEEQNKENQ